MTREQVFLSYARHPWLKKSFKKLTAIEVNESLDFIKSNDHLDRGAFDLKVNKMYVDKVMPKHWAYIKELLSCANSSLG